MWIEHNCFLVILKSLFNKLTYLSFIKVHPVVLPAIDGPCKFKERLKWAKKSATIRGCFTSATTNCQKKSLWMPRFDLNKVSQYVLIWEPLAGWSIESSSHLVYSIPAGTTLSYRRNLKGILQFSEWMDKSRA